MPALTRDDFLRFWPEGYRETFVGYPAGAAEQVAEVAKRYTGGVALDIGCGRGDLTTQLLVPNFGKVIALDLMAIRPTKLDPSVTYIQVPDRDYSCFGVGDASVDFVWSFGCFCHLPNSAVQAYLHSIRRVLKPNGVAVVAMANWPRHPTRRLTPDPTRFREDADDGWYYCDTETAERLAAGFAFCDLLPDFRDTLAELR